ncbi:hypothetical protein BGP77_15765 [Saccharospirillum sp. MSK14-1]|uniref:hypothetical protein n=1 Tax=Saccharospirillum sp. MSK14-1 TaxID=1897632 RepID=UPI000D364598|nr:hypothetical protein [Saccharospirillum sp. MSK14-1]PTY37917.1 hypothetical protein BGP77_15765 [Saccharospirillum sp. MSK14-1]
MRKKILVAVAILMTSGLAYADRDGILLSAGFGLGGNKLIYVNEEENVDLDASWGGAFQLKLGGIISHQHAVYLHFQNSLFSFQETSSRDEFAAFTGFSGLGYTYFANPTIGSPYIEASIGRAAFVAIESASTSNNNSPFMQAAQGSTF